MAALSRSALGITLLLLFSATVVAQDEAAGAEEDKFEPAKPFNPRDAIAKLYDYQDAHPEFAAGIATWITVGTILLVFGFILFMYSEISAVLVVRDQDFRARLIDQKYMTEGKSIEELNVVENGVMAPRPYLSLFGFLLFFVAIACIAYPLCDILAVLGLPSAPCLIIVTFGAFFAAICTASFWMFVVWSCTRPWAALVFLLISLTGQILLPTGNPILLLIWVALVTLGGVGYFYYGPEHYRDKKEEKPVWLQDVGDFTVSTDPNHVVETLKQKTESDAKRMSESLRLQELQDSDKAK